MTSDLAEIVSATIRASAWWRYNPLLAEERSRKREELLAATEAGLERVAREVARRTRKRFGAAELGPRPVEGPATVRPGALRIYLAERGSTAACGPGVGSRRAFAAATNVAPRVLGQQDDVAWSDSTRGVEFVLALHMPVHQGTSG